MFERLNKLGIVFVKKFNELEYRFFCYKSLVLGIRDDLKESVSEVRSGDDLLFDRVKFGLSTLHYARGSWYNLGITEELIIGTFITHPILRCHFEDN